MQSRSRFVMNWLGSLRSSSLLAEPFLFYHCLGRKGVIVTPSEFPLPGVSGSNPIPLYFEMLPESFVVNAIEFDDGGKDYALQVGGVGMRRWIIRYDGLTIAQAAILDAHLASCFYSEDEGSAFGFNFRHHVAGTLWSDTSGTLYSNCHYSAGGYKTSHLKVWSNAREIMIEQRP